MIKILHLGLGRFHRAHQAVFYQRLKELGHHWDVVSMSMRSSDARDDMRSVSFKYPVVEFGSSSKILWVDTIREAYSCHDDLKEVVECFLRPEIEIVTLTVTEKGYDLNSQGRLDLNKTSIKEDLAGSFHPKSAIGILALGLHERRLSGLGPLTVISCDNLRENSHKLRNALIDYLQALNWTEDVQWVKNKISFPNSMVDRIVPALTEEKTSTFEDQLNLPKNSQLVATEEFIQWVIEDQFALPRPPLDKVGVQFVKDVRPYEEMKLKLLNSAHSFLAYAGLNKGYSFVHEAIADEELNRSVQILFDEVIPLLNIPSGFDAREYGRRLIHRFQNSKLPHQLRQIAMDGSQKLPQRIFPSYEKAVNENQSHKVLLRTICEWIEFCSRTYCNNSVLEDPLSSQMKLIPLDDKRKWREEFLKLPPFHHFQANQLELILKD